MKFGLVLLIALLAGRPTRAAHKEGSTGTAGDITLWIDVKEFLTEGRGGFWGSILSGGLELTQLQIDGYQLVWEVKVTGSNFPMEIFAIADGVVLPYILDPNFEKYLPIIPAEVVRVNFTWKAGDQKYYYDFDQLKSFNESILSDPLISIEPKGKVPRKSRIFQVILPCLRNQSGIASFGISLKILNDRGAFLPGTPLRLKLKKQCGDHGPDPECDKKCANGGRCNQHGICQCPKGYMGKYCDTALCYPVCINGGSCVAPGICACADGYQGAHCEGGMCREKCLNGGKCIQKDTCHCRRGYYGDRCEYSKCNSVPCLNNGRCIGINRCRCQKGYMGNQCESLITKPAELSRHEGCKRKCVNGICQDKRCMCEKGWFGSRCNRQTSKKERSLENSNIEVERATESQREDDSESFYSNNHDIFDEDFR